MRLPRSLVGRITLLVGAVSVLSFVLHLALMALWMGTVADDVAAALGGRAKQAHEWLAQAPPPAREALAQRLSSGRFLMQRLAAPDTSPETPIPPLAGTLIVQLKTTLPAGFQVRLPGADKAELRGQLHLDFSLDGEPWRMQYTLQPPVMAFLGTSLGWLALVAAAVFTSLALGLRFIARPISQLAERLHAQGSRIKPLPAQPAGSASELQQLTAAFNRLALAVRQADEDRAHMLAGVSHDLRTPLARLKLRIETELSDATAGRLQADIEAIERIVSQFLAYVQGDGGAGLGEPDDAAAVLQQVAAGYAAQGHAVQASIDETASLPLPDLALQRIASNLIDNALAYGAPPVRVVLRRDGGERLLEVSDRGAGMDAATFEVAQQPFVRVAPDGGSPAGSGHVGLGLAIVARLAAQLGATLEARRSSAGFAVAVRWRGPA
jgi:two-component system, OmpR family, osmolarity sensor histidine kinase EnvZ